MLSPLRGWDVLRYAPAAPNKGVSSHMHMTKFQKFTVIFGGPIIGIFFLYIAFMMITDIPDKETLLWLSSSDVTDIRYIEANDGVTRIRFSTESGCCISVSSKKEGFSSLLEATRNGENFSIGYNKERELFSESPKLYNIIYEIVANGSVVKSYEEHVKTLKYILWGVGLMGLFMLGGAVYYGYFGFPEQS